ncbi:MAG: GntR family transcriptional regulator [Planctomycetales bacterium]
MDVNLRNHFPPLDPNSESRESTSSSEPSRVDEVYEGILLRIIRGELLGGTELKSTRLAREMGLSRTPVVQALQRLASDGVVQLEMNKRAVVRSGAENWLVEIHQLRELLEPQAAATAADRMEPDQLDVLRQAAKAAKPRRGREDWTDAAWRFDSALHLAVADASGNLALAAAIRKCWSFKRLSYLAAPETTQTLTKGYQEHMAILDALATGDGPTASAAMLFHLRSAAKLRPSQRVV